jgi:hypothetical protein
MKISCFVNLGTRRIFITYSQGLSSKKHRKEREPERTLFSTVFQNAPPFKAGNEWHPYNSPPLMARPP